MAYAVRRRRFPSGMAGTYPIALGDGLGFDWGSFATGIGTSAAQGAASAGVQALRNVIVGASTPSAPAASAPAAATASTVSSIPIYVWALGGMGLVLVLVMAMRR